jgi:hypothetical protein
MVWIIVAPSLLALLAAAILFPYPAVQAAFRQARHPDARRQRKRFKREVRHALRFAQRAIVPPLILLGIVQALLLLHYTELGPGAYLAGLFGDYHPEVSLHSPDLDAWLGAYHDTADPRTGTASATPTRVGELFWTHWPLYPIYLGLSVLLLGVHFTGTFARAERDYVLGVRSRRAAYLGV